MKTVGKISLQEIDRENFFAVAALRVAAKQQNFVASNAFSIAQSKVQPECMPLAVCLDNVPIGFAMYCMDVQDKEYWIYRLMIDEHHQNKGYGYAAMQLLLQKIRQDTGHHVIYISFEPKNKAARALYEKLGFVPDGREDCGETVYRLSY